MKAPAPRIEDIIVSMADDPRRIIGHHYGIRTYKAGITQIADKVLNIPCEEFTNAEYYELVAMTLYRWREEHKAEAWSQTTYGDWVRDVFRPDLARRIHFLMFS